LLYVSKINDVSVQVSFSNGGCKKTRGSIVLDKGTHIGTLYKLDTLAIQCNSVSTKSSKAAHVGKEKVVPLGANSLEVKLLAEKTMLWHHRLGHI